MGSQLGDVPQRLSRRALEPARPAGRRLAGASFFLVAFYAVVSVGLGNVTELYQPVPHWNPLDWNVGYLWQAIQDVLPGGRTWDVFVRTIALRRRRGDPLAGDRLPGRLLHVAARRALARRRSSCCSCCRSGSRYLMRMFAWTNLLDSTRLRGPVPRRALDRRAAAVARPARRHDWLGGQHDHGDHGARLRLRAVPDPAALRVAGPDRPAADRGRARPRRAADLGVLARRRSRSRRPACWPASC